jgi:AraC family transcriptional regulator
VQATPLPRVLPKWHGRIYLWTGRALYLGPFYATDMHAHHAVQLTLEEALCPTKAAILPSNQPHQIVADGALTALLFFDPEGKDIKRLPSGFETKLLSDDKLEVVRNHLESCWHNAVSSTLVERVLNDWLEALSPSATRERARDVRVLAAITVLKKTLNQHVSVADLAAQVGLSQSRLSHLFRSHTGLPVRRYVLWLRLQEAVRIIADGHSLTEAAHAAGFADSAHVTRTFHSMFGLAPSVIASSQFVQAS